MGTLEEQVAALTGESEPVLKAVASGAPGMTTYKDAAGSEFWVEPATGQIRSFFNMAAYEASTTVSRLGGETAILADADARLRRAYSRGRIARMKRSVKRLTGGMESDVWVTYREYVDGVGTFNRMVFDYSASGRLLNVSMLDIDLGVGLRPKITSDEAVRIVVGEAYVPVDGDGAKLTVEREPNGAQRLTWDVELYAAGHPDGPRVQAWVDAQTGAVTGRAEAAISY